MAEKEKTLLEFFKSVKGLIDRTSQDGSKDSDARQESDNLPKNIGNKTKENILWLCDKCDFQSRSETILMEHMKVDHEG